MIRPEKLFRMQAPSLDQAHQRLSVIILLFAAGFLVVAARAVDLGVLQYAGTQSDRPDRQATQLWERADIVDRRGTVLATTVTAQSLYVTPARLQRAEATARALAGILPDLSASDVMERFRRAEDRRLVHRHLTPAQVSAVNNLGEPGLNFEPESLRLYPNGRLAAHVLGYTGVDNRGLAGVEHFFDRRLTDPAQAPRPLRLSLDLRVQHAATDELRRAMTEFRAKGAAALVMDVHTGELLALVSLPDFNANRYDRAGDEQRRNRATLSTYELGSALKTITVAAALDKGVVDLDDRMDARKPIRIGGFTIHDDHAKKRYLSVPEVYAFSSNIGAARLADALGTERQRRFFDQAGLLTPTNVEVPEIGRPQYPTQWGRIHTMTAAFGHGIAMTPVNLAQAMAAMVNGGRLHPATLVADPGTDERHARQVISPRTSATIRRLMRLAVVKGTGSYADVPGFKVAGKTGTAEKAAKGGYDPDRLISSFTGVFPADRPRFLVFAMLDEPQGTKQTANFATGGWVAAPTVGNIIKRVGALMGVEPEPRDTDFIRDAALYVQED